MGQDKNKENDTIRKLNNELQELKHSFESLKKSIGNDPIQKTLLINALKENENHSLNLYQNALINYQLLDSNACIIDVNPTWLNNLGYIRDEVIGHPFSKFITPESAELAKTHFPDFKKSGKNHAFEFEMIRKDGTHLFVNMEGNAVLDETGNFKQTHCIWIDITKCRQAETENRIKNLAIESSINAIAISDLQGILTYVNPAFVTMWGYNSSTEVIGKQASGFWQTKELDNEVTKAIYQNGVWTGELVALKKDKNQFDVQVSSSLVKDSAGQPVSLLASFTEITKSKHADKIQSAIEISYRELFNNVADAIYILDVNGTLLDVNEGAVKMYGYTHEELVGKNPMFVAAPGKNDMAAIAAMIEKAYAGESQQFEFWGLRSNGEIFPKEVRVINGTYFGKKVNIVMAQDITERKQIETAIQESERRFRNLIEFAVDGILIGSVDGTIIEANSYMLELTGRTIENLKGLNITEIFDPNVLISKPLRYDLLNKDETVISERNILRHDGKIIPIEMHTKLMPDGTYQSIFRDVTERKKAENILLESETKFKSLVESTSDMIWETNIQGKYTYVSPQFQKLLGYSPEEVVGTSPFFYIADENISEIIEQSNAIVSKAIPFNALVQKFKNRNGHILYFETSGVPIYDQAGKLTGYRGVSRDISKRYLAEKELHKLSKAVQQSPNTVIITDLEGKMEYINPAGCSISGYSFDELIGKSPSIFKSGETDEDVYKSLWRLIKAGKEWKGIFYNKKKNGEHFCESASILPIKDADGTTTHYLGIKEDISKRLKAETALKESEERFRKLFEASPDAIILADIETGMLIDANTAACKMLGRSLNEIRKMHQTMLHPSRDIDYSRKTFEEHSKTDQLTDNLQSIESIIIRSDGSEIPVEVVSNTVTLNGRNILQGVFRNIAERKHAREELLKAKEIAEASDKLKSAFLQNITHELRTPLNGIIGFSEMITQMDSSEEDRIEFNKMIKRSSARLINTITNYMDISMIVMGITEINKHPFNLRNFLNKITDQTVEACNSRNLLLEIIKKVPDDDIQIITDENLLTKIFSHLIDNAIKFTKKGSITIVYNFNDGNHYFSVSDTGTGISEETLPVIFEIFRQADISASREYEGSGLGLSIAKGFVKQLGGAIWLESTSSEGSTFCFSLPASTSGSNKFNFIQNPSQADQPIVLVAEDDDSNYKYLEIVLKKASFNVLRSYNGYETIEICRNFPEISLLLTDIKMPGMDGFESTRQIRKILPQLPIIALSGLISSDDEDAARLAGCNDYIIKPISKSKLLGTIDKLLHRTKY